MASAHILKPYMKGLENGKILEEHLSEMVRSTGEHNSEQRNRHGGDPLLRFFGEYRRAGLA